MKITAIVGTYRKGGMIDQALDEIPAAAREEGAETSGTIQVDGNDLSGHSFYEL
jgi:multimeric flavodoxin WrbA